MPPLPLALAVLVAAPSALPAGQVWVVASEGGPGVDATEIDDALALASDGDLILVQDGAFAPFTVDGLSVTIQGVQGPAILPDFGDPAPPVAVTIRNLAPGQSVVVRDLVVFQFGQSSPALELRDNAGPVVLEDLFVDFLGGATGIAVADSASVALSGCFVQVKHLSPDGVQADEAAGLDVLRSSVFAHETAVGGPLGFGAQEDGSGGTLPAGSGAPGVRLRGATLTATGVQIAGGAGGSAFGPCAPGGDGGAGVVVDEDELGTPSLLRLGGGFAAGGAGGFVGAGCGASNGAHGPPLELLAGSALTLDQAPRYVDVQSVALPRSILELTLLGQPGDLAFLVAGPEPEVGLFLPGPDVSLHVLPDVLVPLGPIVSTEEERTLSTPALPPALEFLSIPMQGLFVAPDEAFLTGPTGTTLVP